MSAFSTTIKIPKPRLWSPATPNLYPVSLQAKVGKRTVGTYVLNTGIRSIKVGFDGRLILNGQYVDFRGVGLHEDSKARASRSTTRSASGSWPRPRRSARR